MLLSLCFDDETDDKRMFGVVDRFTDISSYRWYNRNTRQAATVEERASIRIPPEMRANYRGYYVLLDTRSHLLVFPTYEAATAISPRQALNFFRELVEREKIMKRFGTIAVNIAQEPAALDRILNAPQLRYLELEVHRPNASLGALDEDFHEEMDAIRASKFRWEAVADERGGLKPDAKLRKAAKIALTNGVVRGRVHENGITQPVSTEHYPVDQTIVYSEDSETRVAAMRRAASSIVRRLREAFNKK